MRSPARWALVAGLLAWWPCLSVRAAEHARCDVAVVHALHDGDDGQAPTIDPRIDRLRPYLLKPPFTAWKQFKLLERHQLDIPLKGQGTFKLPNGREAGLDFVEHSNGPGDHRLRLRLEIHEQDKKFLDTTFVLDEGGVVLQGGQRFEAGVLVLGLSCKTHD